MTRNTSFSIDTLDGMHLVLRDSPGYWEDYRKGESADGNDRFEFKPGWQTVYARQVEAPVVRVRLGDGTPGWGEANVPIGPEAAVTILENVLFPMVKGREFGHPAEMWDFLYDAQRGRGYASGYYLDAMAALDIAVWDALGRRAGVPVAALIAESPRAKIPVYLSGIRKATLNERIEHVKWWHGTGLRGVKIFLTADIDAALSELDALQAGAPEMRKWMVDTLWMCSLEEAVRARAEFERRGVVFFECPLQPEDLEGHRALLTHPGAPVALGEHFRTRYQVRPWFSPPALDVFQPDIGRTGISDGLRQMQLAEEAGIPTTPHMGSGTSLFQAATLQFAAACAPTHLAEFQGGLADRLGDAADSAWRYENGGFRLPDRPGLGVEIDEGRLQRFVA